MLSRPTLLSHRSLAALLKSCTAAPFALALHCLSIKLNLNTHVFSASALTALYSKLRRPAEARKVFDELPDRDEVCVSALIVGLARNSRAIDALIAFAEMRRCNVGSTAYGVSGALHAAGEVAAAEQCRVIHGHALVVGFDREVVVACGLIDGYGKAGLVRDARGVFDEMTLARLNLVGWNSMMGAYAQHGDKESVLELFNAMVVNGFVPDDYSFLAVLTGFCNAGLFVECERWLERMRVEYGVEPGLEHFTCLVAAMGRAGQLKEAERIALTMPFEPDAAVWRALLSSCAYNGAADMAWVMAKRLLELDPNNDSAYAIAANVLSKSGRWDEVAAVRMLMKGRRVKKEGGKSWIEVKGEVHVFFSADRRHERTKEIYLKLAELLEEIEKLGYAPVWDEMLHEIGEEEKREALWCHSEKLALAFGLVSGPAPPGKALRIVKNVRICKDCHEAFKYMSRVVEREIIVRDVNRYHRILNGGCTCSDVW